MFIERALALRGHLGAQFCIAPGLHKSLVLPFLYLWQLAELLPACHGCALLPGRIAKCF